MVPTTYDEAALRMHRAVLPFLALLILAASAFGQGPDVVRPRAAAQAPCSVGYLPAQFAGKPDPWPGDVPLPNEELLAAYIARYGQPPGSGGSRVGYCCELFGLNYEALENAANNGGSGPNNEPLHPGCVSTTEATDASFTIPRGGPFVGQWVVARRDGGSAEHPQVVHETSRPCGPFSSPRVFFGAYTGFFDNKPPCGEVVSLCGNGRIDPGETCTTCPQDAGPCPTCGNGRTDPGETCATCPQDLGPCPTCGNGRTDPGETCVTCPQDLGPCPVCQPPKVCIAPCPTLAAVPLTAKSACTTMLTWFPRGSGKFKKVKDACEVIQRAEAYKPIPPP